MAPRKQPSVQSDSNRVTTRTANANKHPGIEAQNALRVQNRRDPKVVQAEKEKKKADKEAKERARQEEAARKEVTQRNLEEYRARQAADLKKKDEVGPRQRAKGTKITTPTDTETVATKKPAASRARKAPAQPSDQPPAAEETSVVESTTLAVSTSTRSKKRKSETVSDNEQSVAGAKKAKAAAKTNPPEPKCCPAPRPILKKKAQPTGQATVSSVVVPGNMAQKTKTSEGQVRENPATRKRSSPAGNDIGSTDDLVTPVRPSKKIKPDQKNVNKPRPLRRTETMIELANGSVVLRRPTNADVEMCDDTTPRQRDFQCEATNIESDEDLEPYETPVVLQKKKKKVAPAPVIESSEAEDSEVERNNRKVVERRKNKGKSSVANSAIHEEQLATTVTGTVAQKGKAPNGSRSSARSANEKSCESSAPTSKVPSRVATMASAPNSSGTARTTASNNIAAKTTDLVSKSKKTCSNAEVSGKPKNNPEPESEPESVNLSGEDDSLEREAALSSPIKGMASRKSSETKIRVKRKSPKQTKPIPKEAEARFYGIVLPYWHQKFSTTDDAWKSPDEDDRTSLRDVCELVFGDELELDLSDDSEAWKKAIAYEWQFRSRLKVQAFQSVQDDYLARHVDDPDALENTEKRIQYGKYLCTEDEWAFLYGKIGDDGTLEDIYQNNLIIKTFSVHYSFATPTKTLRNFKVAPPQSKPCPSYHREHWLKMFRDGRLEYKNGILSIRKTQTAKGAGGDGGDTRGQKRSAKFDFSGNNYLSCTLGYIAGIEVEYKEDRDFFKRIRTQVNEVAGVRRSPHDDDQDKFAKLRSDPQFLARAALGRNKGKKINQGNSTGHKDALGDKDIEGSNDIEVDEAIKGGGGDDDEGGGGDDDEGGGGDDDERGGSDNDERGGGNDDEGGGSNRGGDVGGGDGSDSDGYDNIKRGGSNGDDEEVEGSEDSDTGKNDKEYEPTEDGSQVNAGCEDEHDSEY